MRRARRQEHLCVNARASGPRRANAQSKLYSDGNETILNNVSLHRAARGLGVAATRDLCCASGVFGSRLRRVAPHQSHSHPMLLAQSMGLCVRESASSDPQQWQLGLEVHCSGYASGFGERWRAAGARRVALILSVMKYLLGACRN